MITPTLAVFLASATFAAAVFLVMVAVMQRSKPVTVRDRLETLGATVRPGARGLEEIELSKPFSERVIKPMLQSMARIATRLAPGSNVQAIAGKLDMAGNPRNLSVEMFLGLKVAAGIVFAAVALALQFILPPLISPPTLIMTSFWTAVVGVAGFFFPELWIKDLIRKRQKAIRKVLPDTIDVLSISVEAGLGFDSAISRVCQKSQNPLTIEFERYLTEMRLGKSRREALRQIQARTGVDDLNTFVGAIIQADQLGVSIAKILRIQAEQLRMKRRQRAEKLAQEAPLKMLFPMILFIFPSVFVVILGPAIPQIMNAFG